MRSLTFAVLLAVPAVAAAQAADTLTGRVTDQAGQPMPLATVEITDLGRSVTTAADGTFRVALPPGRRTLSTGAQIGKPVIRGLSGPRVLVLENGSRL